MDSAAAATSGNKRSQSYRSCMLSCMGLCSNTRKKKYFEYIKDPETGVVVTQEKKLSFISVPRDEDVRRTYLERLCWDPAIPVPEDSYLCHIHFEKKDLKVDLLGRTSLLNQLTSFPKQYDADLVQKVHQGDVESSSKGSCPACENPNPQKRLQPAASKQNRRQQLHVVSTPVKKRSPPGNRSPNNAKRMRTVATEMTPKAATTVSILFIFSFQVVMFPGNL